MSYGSTTSSMLQQYCDRFQSLRTDQHEGRPRPHKACMLLAVLSLADNGQLVENRIIYGPELLELFKRYFNVVKGPTDQCTPWNPFFYLRGERFWHLTAPTGKEVSPGAARSGATLIASVAYASLDDDLFTLIAQPASREVLRQAIIDRYFSVQRQNLLALSGEERQIGMVRETWRDHGYQASPDETTTTARDAAFARTVKKAYDYRCAACGLRFLYDEITIIDAAHLIPFSETRDDSPQNGMALCKNHHWLMDCQLIAPGPARGKAYDDLRWHIRDGMNERIEGQREVMRLRNKTVILPSDFHLQPKREAVDRRMELLREAC